MIDALYTAGADALGGAWPVVWSLIKDGDHRLSRPQDIARMVATVLATAGSAEKCQLALDHGEGVAGDLQLEGGGAVLTALEGGHVQVGSGDAAEMGKHHLAGKVRILAVMSPERLPGELKDIPTAKEQGYDIVWPVVRGFYLGPKVSDADYAWWKDAFDKLLASEEFAKLRDQRELFPFAMTGQELDTYVKKQVADYKVLAKEFGLIQ